MKRRGGFTLIELLVVISIIAFIAGLTVLIGPSLQRNQAASRGAEQVQAQLFNAKQIALRDNTLYGIRFISDGGTVCRSMQYIFQPDDYRRNRVMVSPTDGTLVLFESDISDGIPNQTAWPVRVGDFIQIQDHPQPRRIVSVIDARQVRVASSINGPTDAPTDNFRVMRSPRPAPGEEVVQLPTDVVVDFNLSQIPVDSTTGQYDVLFSPAGPVVGTGARSGKIILWVRDVNVNYTTAREQGLIVVFTRAGSIGSYQVDTSNPAAVQANPTAGYTYTNDPRANGL